MLIAFLPYCFFAYCSFAFLLFAFLLFAFLLFALLLFALLLFCLIALCSLPFQNMLRLLFAGCLLLLLTQTACYEPIEGCLEVEATNFDASADQNCCCEYPQLVLDVVQWFDSVQFVENAAYPAPLNNHIFRLKSVTFYLSDFQLVQNNTPYTVSDMVQLRAFGPTGLDTINETLTDDFLLVRRQSFRNDLGDFRTNGTFEQARMRLGLTEQAGRVVPRLAPVGHPLHTQADSLWHGPGGAGYIFFQVVLARDTASATVPDTISFSRADLGDFFMQSQAPVRHATGYDFQLRLLAEYKNLLEGIDLTTGDISIWKSQMKANLPQVFSVSQ